MKHSVFALVLSLSALCFSCSRAPSVLDRRAVVVITDLYYPAQDVGDNIDILTPYALPQIDLRGVIFDITQHFREINDDNTILRDAGYIPVIQLNYLFDCNVPCACSPFSPLRSIDDRKEDVSNFEQQGIELLFRILEESAEPIDIVSTGSCRTLAVAINRRPELMRSKVAAVHIVAGASSDKFTEWNIALDSLAAAAVLRSGLNVDIYPCATENGPFDRGEHNTFWSLRDLSFVLDMESPLRQYLLYQFLTVARPDYLNYLTCQATDAEKEALLQISVDKWYGSGGRHYVWETAVWQQLAGLKLVQHLDGSVELVAQNLVSPDDKLFDEGLHDVEIEVDDNGLFRYRYSDYPTGTKIYYRSDPELNERWLNEALPKLYLNYKSKL